MSSDAIGLGATRESLRCVRRGPTKARHGLRQRSSERDDLDHVEAPQREAL